MSAMNIEPGLNAEDFPEYGAPKLAGDSHDDDGQVIDSFFIETDQPPTIPAETPAVTHMKPPRRTNRLVSGFQVIDLNTLNTSMQILAADIDRVSVTVKVNGVGATDSIRIADGATKFESITEQNLTLIATRTTPAAEAVARPRWCGCRRWHPRS